MLESARLTFEDELQVYIKSVYEYNLIDNLQLIIIQLSV
jgi:hypothetical protein